MEGGERGEKGKVGESDTVYVEVELGRAAAIMRVEEVLE